MISIHSLSDLPVMEGKEKPLFIFKMVSAHKDVFDYLCDKCKGRGPFFPA